LRDFLKSKHVASLLRAVNDFINLLKEEGISADVKIHAKDIVAMGKSKFFNTLV
jgi:hypothetical protein